MLSIDNKEISLSKGDRGVIQFDITQDGEPVTLETSDKVTMSIYSEENLDKEPLQVLNAEINVDDNIAEIPIIETSTDFVPEDNMPFNYWYQIEWNDNVMIGYDKEGPKIFRVYPQGKENKNGR